MPIHRLDVLDHGFVEFIDSMGSDRRIAEAAWISTDSERDRTDEEVARVIRYMAWHQHVTPFFHVTATFRIKMPVFVARQWMRSNIGIAYNEESRRYVDSPPEFFRPAAWRARGDKIKQGSGEGVVEYEEDLYVGVMPFDDDDGRNAEEVAKREYERRLAAGIAPELARICLPVSHYTMMYMTGSIAAFARVYLLRVDPHAQYEAMQYGQALGHFLAPKFPVAWAELIAAGECVKEALAAGYKNRPRRA